MIVQLLRGRARVAQWIFMNFGDFCVYMYVCTKRKTAQSGDYAVLGRCRLLRYGKVLVVVDVVVVVVGAE